MAQPAARPLPLFRLARFPAVTFHPDGSIRSEDEPWTVVPLVLMPSGFHYVESARLGAAPSARATASATPHMRRVDALICEAFYGKPDLKQQRRVVVHRNHDRKDDQAANLAWTAREPGWVDKRTSVAGRKRLGAGAAGEEDEDEDDEVTSSDGEEPAVLTQESVAMSTAATVAAVDQLQRPLPPPASSSHAAAAAAASSSPAPAPAKKHKKDHHHRPAAAAASAAVPVELTRLTWAPADAPPLSSEAVFQLDQDGDLLRAYASIQEAGQKVHERLRAEENRSVVTSAVAAEAIERVLDCVPCNAFGSSWLTARGLAAKYTCKQE